MNTKMETKELIDELYRCAGQCTFCYNGCEREKEKDQLERCMMLDQDCADICRLTGHILERGSESSDLFLQLSKELCERCATECEKHAHHDHCKKCAETCRECIAMIQQGF
jgi:hypothetical protein